MIQIKKRPIEETLVLIVLLFLIVFVPFRNLLAEYSSSMIKLIPDILIICLFFFKLIKSKFKLKIHIWDWAFLGFIVYGLINTVFINDVGILSYIIQVRSISSMYLMYIIIKNSDVNKEDFKKIIKLTCIVALVLVCFSFIEKIFNKDILFPSLWANSIQYKANFARTYSLLGNPNIYAAYLYIAMILGYFANKEKIIKVRSYFYVLCITGILLSASRSIIILLTILLLFTLYYILKQKNFQKMLITLGIIIVALILNDFTEYTNRQVSELRDDESVFSYRIGELFGSQIYKDSAEDGRIYVIKTGLRVLGDYPIFGTGFGTFGSSAALIRGSVIYEKYNIKSTIYSDNEYIKVLVETGIVGTLIFCTFCFFLFKDALHNKYKMIMFISFIALGMFYNVFEIQVLTLYYYLSIVLFNTIQIDKSTKAML